MDSIIPWPGGKNKTADMIVKMMPEHYRYVEVFAGGLSIFFAKPRSKIEVVNDLNGELVNFYRVIQKDCEDFKKRAKYPIYSRELYMEYLEDYNSGKHKSMDKVERAFRFFYLIRSSFSSIFGTGWTRSVSMFNSFFSVLKDVDKFSRRLERVFIDNRDCVKVVEGYDAEDSFMVLDPPYVKAGVDELYFKSLDAGFTKYDHQRLYMALKSMKGKFLLTIDDVPFIRERYTKEDGFYTMEVETFYPCVKGVEKIHVTELIITNYDPTKIKRHLDLRQGKLEF